MTMDTLETTLSVNANAAETSVAAPPPVLVPLLLIGVAALVASLVARPDASFDDIVVDIYPSSSYRVNMYARRRRVSSMCTYVCVCVRVRVPQVQRWVDNVRTTKNNEKRRASVKSVQSHIHPRVLDSSWILVLKDERGRMRFPSMDGFCIDLD